MIVSGFSHIPVLEDEAIEALSVRKGKKYIDATGGAGGHSKRILDSGVQVLVIDRDPDAVAHLREIFKGENRVRIVRGNFKDIKEISQNEGFGKVAGILFDLGLSGYQIDKSERGFSYLKNEYLDMRADKDTGITAAEIINSYSRERLYEIFSKHSEELHSGAISAAIVHARKLREISRSFELNDIVGKVTGKEDRKKFYSTLSRVYQALRMEVNGETENLKTGVRGALDILEIGGRLCVISFHSVEDRIVKKIFREEKDLRIVSRKPINAGGVEVTRNPRSRSAKLRIAEKI